jgi:hypothetical protein
MCRNGNQRNEPVAAERACGIRFALRFVTGIEFEKKEWIQVLS